MNRKLVGMLAGIAGLVLFAGPAWADIPDIPCPSTASAGGSLYVTPGGGGQSLSEVGATISVTVLDHEGQPIGNYPFQDIWPGGAVPGLLNMCNGGASADGNTNGQGQTTISGTIAGGGLAVGVRVYFAGVTFDCEPPLAISINSPDITGDLVVDLADIGPFSRSLHTQTNIFRADYFRDGKVDLADVGIFAQFIGDACQY